MSEELAKKKRVRGAHKASATKIMQQVTELVGSESPNQAKLACLQLALNEKLKTICGSNRTTPGRWCSYRY